MLLKIRLDEKHYRFINTDHIVNVEFRSYTQYFVNGKWLRQDDFDYDPLMQYQTREFSEFTGIIVHLINDKSPLRFSGDTAIDLYHLLSTDCVTVGLNNNEDGKLL
jgi:hypothetical protein